MATINTSDVSFSIIPEAVLGTTPSTGDRYEIPTKEGQSIPTYKGNEIASETMRPNRSANGSRRGNGSGDGSFDVRLQVCDAVDFLMQSACSGVWADVGPVGSEVSTLKAGKTDSSFTTVSAISDTMYEYAAGGVCSSMSISGSAAGGVSASFGMVFTARNRLDADSAIQTVPVDAVEFVGADITNVKIGSQILQFNELTCDVNQDREMVNILGSTVPIDVGTTGQRGTRMTLKAYRSSFDIDDAITGEAQEVSFEIKYNGVGYKFIIPAGYGSVPYNESANKLLVVMEFVAGYDPVTETDFIIEKIG